MRLALLQGRLADNPFDRSAIVAAWYLINHYRYIDQKAYSISKNKSFDESFQENTDCLVCQDLAQSPISLACGHMLCAECLLKWFAQRPMSKVGSHHQCPVCRFDFETNLKNFLWNHPKYQALVAESLQKYQKEDDQELIKEQSEFDLDFIQNHLLSQEEYELLVSMQEEFDRQNNQFDPEALDKILQYLRGNNDEEQGEEVPMLVENNDENEVSSNASQEEDESNNQNAGLQEYSDEKADFLTYAINFIFDEEDENSN